MKSLKDILKTMTTNSDDFAKLVGDKGDDFIKAIESGGSDLAKFTKENKEFMTAMRQTDEFKTLKLTADANKALAKTIDESVVISDDVAEARTAAAAKQNADDTAKQSADDTAKQDAEVDSVAADEVSTVTNSALVLTVADNTRKVSNVLKGTNSYSDPSDLEAVISNLGKQLDEAGLIVADQSRKSGFAAATSSPKNIVEKIRNGETITQKEFNKLDDAVMSKNSDSLASAAKAQSAAAPTNGSGGWMDKLTNPIKAATGFVGSVVKYGAVAVAGALGVSIISASSEDPEVLKNKSDLDEHLETNINAAGNLYKSCAIDAIADSYGLTVQEEHANRAQFNSALSAKMGEQFRECAEANNAYDNNENVIPAFTKEEEIFISHSVEQLPYKIK